VLLSENKYDDDDDGYEYEDHTTIDAMLAQMSLISLSIISPRHKFLLVPYPTFSLSAIRPFSNPKATIDFCDIHDTIRCDRRV